MSLAQVVIGVALLVVGGGCVVGRDRLVASHQARSEGRQAKAPTAYLVMGAILALAGVGQLLLALS